MTLNEFADALWASAVCIRVAGQKKGHDFKSISAACEQFGFYNVINSFSYGIYSIAINVEVPE